jgi:hypothetical protein
MYSSLVLWMYLLRHKSAGRDSNRVPSLCGPFVNYVRRAHTEDICAARGMLVVD